MVTADLLTGLTALHDRGVLHRSVRPDCIRVGAQGGVKLLDVGLFAGDRLNVHVAPEVRGGADAQRRPDIFAAFSVFRACLTGVDGQNFGPDVPPAGPGRRASAWPTSLASATWMPASRCSSSSRSWSYSSGRVGRDRPGDAAPAVAGGAVSHDRLVDGLVASPAGRRGGIGAASTRRRRRVDAEWVMPTPGATLGATIRCHSQPRADAGDRSAGRPASAGRKTWIVAAATSVARPASAWAIFSASAGGPDSQRRSVETQVDVPMVKPSPTVAARRQGTDTVALALEPGQRVTGRSTNAVSLDWATECGRRRGRGLHRGTETVGRSVRRSSRARPTAGRPPRRQRLRGTVFDDVGHVSIPSAPVNAMTLTQPDVLPPTVPTGSPPRAGR